MCSILIKWCFYSNFSGIKSLIEFTKENLQCCHYVSRELENKRKTRRAKCWDTIHEIYDADLDTKVDYVYFCTGCKDVIYNGSKDGNTMVFKRHNLFLK